MIVEDLVPFERHYAQLNKALQFEIQIYITGYLFEFDFC